MSDTLMICDFVASMRHAGYLTFAAAVLGLAEAHYPGLRDAVLRVAAWLVRLKRRAAAERYVGSKP